MTDAERPRTGWHGFLHLWDFIKATLALGTTIAGLLWAVLTYGLDNRYATKDLETQVVSNGAVAKQVADDLMQVRQSLIKSDGLELRIKQCIATSPEARRLFATRISELMDEYYEVTGGQPLNLPSCSELE